MNDFLERIKIILINNPYLLNDNLDNFLYTQLISYNLGNNQEPFKNMEYLFDYWIDRNKYNVNLNTFVSETHPYFCQFVNRDTRVITEEAIKLYIPLDEKHLYEGANRLFDFISKEGIIHNSKIGKKIRNDNIVVRVSNLEEAEKVINFVKNDRYIQEGLLNTNPFTINVDGVGIAKDGIYSYNNELCNSLAKFINILVGHNRLNDLNINTFHEYLEKAKNFGDKDLQMITNLQSIITSGKKLDFNDFKNIINDNYIYKDTLNKEEIFKNVVRLTYNKYNLEWTKNAIIRYRYNGDDSGFTRDNGARYELLKNNISIQDVNNYLNKKNSENIIEDYINNVVGINKSNNEFEYIVNAYKETYIKHGKYQADGALYAFITNGDKKHFTNNNNARNNLDNVNIKNIYNILKDGLNIDAYCTLEELSEYFTDEMCNEYNKGFKY